jgi:spore maturation protein CgeB
LAIAGGLVQIGMVRKANRDGHSMRSYEVPAMGGCLVTEDTPEHRELYGMENETVLYFKTITEMVNKTKQLILLPSEAKRLRMALHEKIINGSNRYRDRLKTLIDMGGS